MAPTRRLCREARSGCHRLDRAVVGPPLAGIIGRRAGAVEGYPYSTSLLKSGIVWSKATLDKWLEGPQQFVPGAVMAMSVPDPATRQDIIAYLEAESAKSRPAAAPSLRSAAAP